MQTPFTVEEFKAAFPAFTDDTAISLAITSAVFDTNCYPGIQADKQIYCVMLATAHVLELQALSTTALGKGLVSAKRVKTRQDEIEYFDPGNAFDAQQLALTDSGRRLQHALNMYSQGFMGLVVS